MPALTIDIFIPLLLRLLSRIEGQDSSIFTPYPALKLSPKTTVIYFSFID
jgi:hypothetical protein